MRLSYCTVRSAAHGIQARSSRLLPRQHPRRRGKGSTLHQICISKSPMQQESDARSQVPELASRLWRSDYTKFLGVHRTTYTRLEGDGHALDSTLERREYSHQSDSSCAMFAEKSGRRRIFDIRPSSSQSQCRKYNFRCQREFRHTNREPSVSAVCCLQS
eukprot:7391711-Prymnesium_polylepis.5